MADRGKLTARERRFVEERAKGLNGVEAIVAMGFRGKRPDVAAAKLSTKPRVRLALEQKLAAVAAKIGVTQEQWFAEVWAIASAKVKRYTGSDKNKALELAGRSLGAFKDTAGEREIIGPGLTIVIQQAVQVGQAPAAPAQVTTFKLMPGPSR